MTTNGTWKITEVDTIPVSVNSPRNRKYGDLYYDLVLRLEKTNLPKALRVEFDDHELAVRMRQAMDGYAKKDFGPKAIGFATRREYGGSVLYAFRGPKWVKPS